jgi:hypothetical protein
LCAYCPLKIDARDGQQRGVVAYAFVKRFPLPMNNLFVTGMTPVSLIARWSSVRMMRMFGSPGT